jgi:hypothetical protein
MSGVWDPASGVQTVSETQQAESSYRILLGTAAIEEYGLEEEAAGLSYVGYTYRTVGNDLLIFGASSKGTANGVYGLLQNELGVRWFGPAPEDIFTVIPERERISVSDLDVTKEPSFYGRPGRALAEEVGGDWTKRIRRGGTYLPFNNASHYLYRMFPPDKYFESHPEYYYMRGGERRVFEPRSHAWSICYSNQEVIDITVRYALNYFRANKFNHSFSVGINDTSAYCECSECKKLQPKRSFRGVRVASDMYYHYVNEVARRVKEEFPDRYIGAIAYNDVTAPPLGEMEDNVFVVLVNDPSEYFDASYRALDEELVAGWEAKGITMGLYYYLDNLAKLTPAYFPRLLASELKGKYARGFRVLFHETAFQPGPLAYVEGRLWWDIDLDVDELLDEYFTMLYGPAAPFMSKLFELFEEIHMRPRKGGFLYEHYKYLQFSPYTAADLEKMESLLDQAHAAIEGMGVGYSTRERKEERRLAYTGRNLKVFMEMLKGRVLAQELEASAGRPLDDIEVLKQLEIIESINGIMARHEQVYRENIVADPYQNMRFRSDTVTPVRNGWKQHLSEAVGKALVNIYKTVRPGGLDPDARVAGMLDRAVSEYTSDKLRGYIFRVKTGAVELGPNLARNPGFEEVWGEGRHADIPEGEEWRRGIPHQWMIQPEILNMGGIMDTMEYDEPHEEFGRRSGRMRYVTGEGDGYYGNSVWLGSNVEPRSAYLVRGSVKVNTGDARMEVLQRVYMRVGWFPRVPRERTSVELNETGQWIQLETVVLLPEENPHSIQVMFMIEGLWEGMEVLFDSLSVQLIKD